ncbi:c-type cytochrome [Hansschlegelia beijingensis]
MSTLKFGLAALALSLGAPAAFAQSLEVGSPATDQDLAGYFAIQPDGEGLPPGSGTVSAGAKVYGERCAACHGDKLQGVPAAGGPALVGGRGTLSSAKPVKTVESYWPYASTLYDYVWRSMPFDQPGSLSADEVYAVSAYVLAKGGVIAEDATMDASSLPKVEMPNAKGFYDGQGPDLSLYAAER